MYLFICEVYFAGYLQQSQVTSECVDYFLETVVYHQSLTSVSYGGDFT